jgi:hypothetical protein
MVSGLSEAPFVGALILSEIHIRGTFSDSFCAAIAAADSPSLKIFVSEGSSGTVCGSITVTAETVSNQPPTPRATWNTALPLPTVIPVPILDTFPPLDDSSGFHYAVSGRALTITGEGEFDGELLSEYLIVLCDPEVFGENCLKAVIEEIVIGEGITAITGDPWWHQTAVRSISLPSSLQFIESDLFTNCESLSRISVGANFDADWTGRWWPFSLQSITSPTDSIGVLLSKDGTTLLIYPPACTDKRYSIPETVTIIESHALEHAVNLEEVIFSNVTVIHSAAFMDCANLRLTALPDSLERLYEFAFARCPKIVSLSVGPPLYWFQTLSSVDDYSPYADLMVVSVSSPFPESLASITVSPANPFFTASSGVLFSKDGTELLHYPRSRTGASYVAPASVAWVGNTAVAGALNLLSISLPSVVTIGGRAFRGCPKLGEVSIPSALGLEEQAFAFCQALGLPRFTTAMA